MVHVYTHIDLVLFVFMKSGTFCMKGGAFYEKYMKRTEKHLKKTTKTPYSTQISHFDLVFHRVQREGQLGYIFWWYLVVHVCVNGTCIHTLTWFSWFSWKVVLFVWKPTLSMKSTWKATKTADSTQISHYDLVFCRVQREGQLDIFYILVVYVVHVCLNGTCIHTYWPGFVGFHEMWCFLYENWYFLWKACEKHWKLKSTWKVKSTPEKWETPQKWKAHEKHMKIEKHMNSIPERWKAHEKLKHMKNTWKVKSATFHEKHMLFIMSFRVIMDFTVDFICWFHYEFHYRFHRNGILSEIHNEILLISVKSCEMLWISWNLVNFSEIQVDVIKFVMKSIMKYGGISMKFAVKSIMKSAVKSVMKSAVKSINDIHSEVCNEICSEICNEFNEIL